jgi:predicted ABC-type ATPase
MLAWCPDWLIVGSLCIYRINGDLHIARARARVAAGGHPIPEEKIRERYPNAQLNLTKLMPHVAYIKVYDNSVEAAADGTVPDPVLVLEMENGQVISPAPDDLKALQRAPEWSKSILEAALRAGPASGA